MRLLIVLCLALIPAAPGSAQEKKDEATTEQKVTATTCKAICERASSKKPTGEEAPIYLQCFLQRFCDPKDDGSLIGHVPTRRGIDG